MSIKQVQDIKGEMHVESPESLIELVNYLNGLGYKVWRFRHKDGNHHDHKEVLFSEKDLKDNVEANIRNSWAASLKFIHRCKFCNNLIKKVIDDGSTCSKCGKTLYLLFPNGSQMELSIDEDTRFMYSLSLSIQERHEKEERTDFYLNFEDCPTIFASSPGSIYYRKLERSYKILQEEIRKFPTVFKVRKKGEIDVVSIDDKDTTLVSSVGREENYKSFRVFDGEEFREHLNKTPAPSFIQIFEIW